MTTPKKSASFQGSTIYDVDAGQQTWQRVFENAQGDMAMVLARLTDDAEADFIDHSGPGRGARIGLPLVNQTLNRSLKMDSSGAKNGGIVTGDTLLFPFVFSVPPGETSIVVELTQSPFAVLGFLREFRPRVRATLATDYTAAAGDDLSVPIVFPTGDGVASAVVTGLTPGDLIVVWVMFSGFDGDGRRIGETYEFLEAITIRPARNAIPTLDLPRDDGNPVPVPAPGSAPLRFEQMSTDLLTTLRPVSGWIASRLSRNAAALVEYLTGAPAGSNRDYTATESAGTDPTVSRFHAGARKGFAAEPLLSIPVVSVHGGGIKASGGYLVDAASSSSYGARQAFAPYPLGKSDRQVLRCRAGVPDFPAAANLRWAVLLGANDTSAVWSEIRVAAQCGVSTKSAAVTPTAVTNAPTSGVFALATGTALAFGRDNAVSADMRIHLEDVGAGAYDPYKACVLAACFWFEV